MTSFVLNLICAQLYSMKDILPRNVLYVSGTGGVLLLAALYLGISGFPSLIKMKIKEATALKNGTEAFKRWEELPFPIDFRVYFFNVTNPKEVTQGERPILKEVGPYVYNMYVKKVKVNFTGDDTLTYFKEKKYYFSPEKSGSLKQTDIITTLNVPLIASAFLVEETFPLGLAFFDSAIPFLFPGIKDPFTRATVDKLLFTGVLINCSYSTGPAMPVCRAMERRVPPSITLQPGTKNYLFSFFHRENSTLQGPYKMHTGTKNIADLGKLIEYQNRTSLSMWLPNTTCSQLRGTDATILPPFLKREDPVYIYLSEICLSLYIKFEAEEKMFGLTLYRYRAPFDNFEDPSKVKENKCRCRGTGEQSKCLKAGAIDNTPCQGAPVIFTPPHFLNCDPEYQKYPVGLHPNKTNHDIVVYIEPKTGAPLIANKRIQMNLNVRPMDTITLLNNISEGMFPILWVDESLDVNVTKKFLPDLNRLFLVILILDCVVWSIAGLGLLCIISALVLFFKTSKQTWVKDNQVTADISFVNRGIANDGSTDQKVPSYNPTQEGLGPISFSLDSTTTNHSLSR